MKVLDLFSGIGGFSIGLERAGFKTVAFCEIDEYCRLVLKKHWKDIKIYRDVREITKQQLEKDGCELPEIITGGVPCQPFSVAGKQKGTEDNRHLWPEMFRVIQDFSPKWIIIENVRGLINIQDGMVFESMHIDLANEGYETQSFIIPAAGVGAPHRRDRVWIVAHSELNGLSSSQERESIKKTISKESQGQNNSFNITGTSSLSISKQIMENSRRTIRGQQSSRNKESIGSGASQKTEWSANSDSLARSSEREKTMANSTESRSFSKSVRNSKGLEKESQRKKERGNQFTIRTTARSSTVANTKSQQSLSTHNREKQGEVGDKKQGELRGSYSRSLWPNNWDIEPDVGRVADGIPGRVHRLKGLGNSIVPQIAEEIGQAIMKAELDSE